MSTIKLDPGTIEALTRLRGDATICDLDGRRVGYFVPPESYDLMRRTFLDQSLEPVSTEELRQSLANPVRHSMADVLKLVEDA